MFNARRHVCMKGGSVEDCASLLHGFNMRVWCRALADLSCNGVTAEMPLLKEYTCLGHMRDHSRP